MYKGGPGESFPKGNIGDAEAAQELEAVFRSAPDRRMGPSAIGLIGNLTWLVPYAEYLHRDRS